MRNVQSVRSTIIGSSTVKLPEETSPRVSPLQPMIILMRVLGIELETSKIASSKCYRYSILAYGLAMLVANIFVNVTILVIEYPASIKDVSNNSIYQHVHSPGSLSSTFAWNIIIDYASYSCLAVGVHGVLLSLGHAARWKSLEENVHRIIHDDQVFPETGKTIKRITLVGVAIISLV